MFVEITHQLYKENVYSLNYDYKVILVNHTRIFADAGQNFIWHMRPTNVVLINIKRYVFRKIKIHDHLFYHIITIVHF